MNKQSGITIIEVLISSFLLLMVLALVGGHINFQKKTFVDGSIRTRINQNLRGTLDIIGTDIRIGGENLPLAFPTFLLTDGGTGSDQLTVRRAVLEDALPLCTAIASGSTTGTIIVADNASATPGCDYTGNKSNFDKWAAYRAEQGGSVKAFIFNIATRDGEFFDFSEEDDLLTALHLRRPTGASSFTYAYPAGTSAIYILEEWKYQVQNDELQVIQNGETTQPLTVMFGVKSFSAEALMSDTTTKTSIVKTDNWTLIQNFSISLTGSETKGGVEVSRTLHSRFFPRNILSF